MPPLPATLHGAWEIKSRQRRAAGLHGEFRPEDEVASTDVGASATVDADCGFVEKTQYETRSKKAEPIRETLASAAEDANAYGVQVVLPSFATFEEKEYSTQEELLGSFSEYCAQHNVAYRVRQSTGRDLRNGRLYDQYTTLLNDFATARKKRLDAWAQAKAHAKELVRARAKELANAKMHELAQAQENANALAQELAKEPKEPTLVQLPPSISYSVRMFECIHAGKQKVRSTGLRFHALTRYTGCTARMTARAQSYEVNVGENVEVRWRIVIDKENTVHNHLCTESKFYSYLNNSKIDDIAMFGRVAAQISAHGNPAIIRHQASSGLGTPFSSRKYSNFKHYQMGAVEAGKSLDELKRKFESVSGNWCKVMRDEGTKMVRGILFQTAIQRAQFQQYGDSLILDWTHNTNSLGFHHGSLLATSATGKGLPVFDFLCLSQATATLMTVLDTFVENNPGAQAKVKSFVIDKDLAEWAAIRAVFPHSRVVLCQFHVVKWFKGCMSNRDYNIEDKNRKPAMKILRAMVYAKSGAEFRRCKGLLHSLLNKKSHRPFHTYMERRWYSMKEQWTDYRRGKVFTAGNTTSNRLESHWKQLKAGLGKRRRIDACFEAIVMRGRSVLSRERDELVEYTSKSRMFPGVRKYVQRVLRSLSASRGELVRRQWDKYAAHPDWFQARVPEGDDVSVKQQPDEEHDVSCSATSEWSCSCRFAVTYGLPCRHQLYVGLSHQKLMEFPVSAVSTRWRMAEAATLVGDLNTAIDQLAAVHVSVPGVEETTVIPPAISTNRQKLPPRPKAVSHVYVRNNERTDALVVDAIYKRNHVRGQLAHVVLPMMELSTPRFWHFSQILEDLLSAFIASTTAASPVHAPPVPSQAEKHKQKGVDQEEGDLDHDVRDIDVRDIDSRGTDPAKLDGCEDQPRSPSEGACEREVEASLDPHRLRRLLNDEDEIDEDGIYSSSFVPVEAAVDADEDDDADEEDLVDVGEKIVLPVPSAHVHAETHSILDAQLPSVDTSLFDYFVLDSPAAAPRFPSLSHDEHVSHLDAIMADLDGDFGFSIVSVDSRGYCEAVATAVVSSSQTFIGTQIPIPSHVDGPEATAAPSMAASPSSACEIAASQHAAGVKRKASEIVNDDLCFSGYLPSARRGTPKQNRQQAATRGHIAAVVTRSDCPLSVADFNTVLQFSKLAELNELLQQYPVLYTESLFEKRAVQVQSASGSVALLNFFLPSVVEARIRSAVNDAKAAKGEPFLAEASFRHAGNSVFGDSQLSAKIVGMAQVINENGLLELGAAGSLKSLHAGYRRDYDWIRNDPKWDKTSSAAPLPFLDDYAAEFESGDTSLGVEGMREAVAATLSSYCLRTTLTVPGRIPTAGDIPKVRTSSVPLDELVGRLRGDEWLNDSVVNFVLKLFASKHRDVSIIDSLTSETHALPADFLTLQRLLVFPVNFDNKHWCVICVEFDWEKPSATAHAYDPLCKGAYDRRLEDMWASWCYPVLKKWFERDQRRVLSATNSAAQDLTALPPIVWRSTITGMPTQDDGFSCGIYCISHALSYMSKDFAMQELATLSPSRLQVMRLRLMYAILTKAVARVDEGEVERARELKASFHRYALSTQETPAPTSRSTRSSRSKK